MNDSDAAPRQPRVGLVEAVWGLFSSPQLTLWLGAGLAIACALGTFVNADERSSAQMRAANGHTWWYPIYLFFEMGDWFHAWWFTLLLALVMLNLGAMALSRLQSTWGPGRWPSIDLISSLPHAARLRTKAAPEMATAEVATALRTRGFDPELTAGEGGATRLFAEKGRLAEVGTWALCLGVPLVLAGALVGQWFGKQGVIDVPMDGGSFDFFFRKTPGGSQFKEPLGFSVRVNDFRVLKLGDGRVRSLESDLAVVDPQGKALLERTVKVGEPLRFDGWTLSQGDFEEDPSRERVKLSISDLKAGGEAKAFSLPKDGEATLADGVRFQVTNYTEHFEQLGPAVQIARKSPDGQKTSFWVLGNYPDFDAKNRGDTYGLRLDGVEPFYFSDLRISRDPGYALWVAGGLLALAGLVLTLSTSHRRVWAQASADGELALAGWVDRTSSSFEADFADLSKGVARALEKARS